MVALERSPSYRVYPLPAVFNFRRPTVLSMAGPEQATIVQSHIYRCGAARGGVVSAMQYSAVQYSECGGCSVVQYSECGGCSVVHCVAVSAVSAAQ